MSQFMGRARDFCLLWSAHTSSETHPATYSVHTGGFLLG